MCQFNGNLNMKLLRNCFHLKMKWPGGALLVTLFLLVIIRYGVVENPLVEKSFQSPLVQNITERLHLVTDENPPVVENPQNGSDAILAENAPENTPVVENLQNGPDAIVADALVANVPGFRNLTDGESRCLQTWSLMSHLTSYAQELPYGIEAMKEGAGAWDVLISSIESENHDASSNKSLKLKEKEEQCPYSIRKMNASKLHDGNFVLKIPCGLVQGSSITIIGTPSGLLGNFRIELIGTTLPGEPDPPIVLHYNVRLHGDKVTEDPVIVQNAWTSTRDWGTEERCPSPYRENNRTVDDLEQCSAAIEKDSNHSTTSGKNSTNVPRQSFYRKEHGQPNKHFPFKQGYLVVTTLRVGDEGIHMTVDGKHITSFAYRDSLEPWLVSEVKISGDINLISVLASGLPTSEKLEDVTDLEFLKSAPIAPNKPLDLFIGVSSTANNFKRRMAVRRTWMQYDAVRSGKVAVRFFVGLHKNQMVNEELWNEARTYGDIQLMLFVDYYNLITWKTIAICIHGASVVSAKYIMKTDDDSFVRVDEVLVSLYRTNMTHGLLYGLIETVSQPSRSEESKWYISFEEWRSALYPPWAHGPGYVVSQDIAKVVYEKHTNGNLKMFKLEDVAMGIWIDEMKKQGLRVEYATEERICIDGCSDGYVVAHYQDPRNMLCLWDKLQESKHATCC